jgi:hypothetical protein
MIEKWSNSSGDEITRDVYSDAFKSTTFNTNLYCEFYFKDKRNQIKCENGILLGKKAVGRFFRSANDLSSENLYVNFYKPVVKKIPKRSSSCRNNSCRAGYNFFVRNFYSHFKQNTYPNAEITSHNELTKYCKRNKYCHMGIKLFCHEQVHAVGSGGKIVDDELKRTVVGTRKYKLLTSIKKYSGHVCSGYKRPIENCKDLYQRSIFGKKKYIKCVESRTSFLIRAQQINDRM